MTVSVPADGVNYSIFDLLSAAIHAVNPNAHVPVFVSAGNVQADNDNTDSLKYDTQIDSSVPMTSTSFGNELEPSASVPIPGGGSVRFNLTTLRVRNDSADIQKLNILVTES